MATSQLVLRINPKLKEKLANIAKKEGRPSSEILRELIETYVRERDIEAYIDDLWVRMGDKLSSKGKGLADVSKTIAEVRKGE